MKPTPMLIAAAALAAVAAVPANAQTVYQCSGVGLEERETADQVPHTVKLVYAEPDGHYLGEVQTTVTDSAGTEVVSVQCPGPWVLLNLPAGRYRITASLGGKTQSRDIAVSAGQRQKQVFRF